MGKKIRIIIISLIIIIAAILGFFVLTEGSSEIVGENSLGSVTKVNYTHSDDATLKIAVVSGMHSREKLHSPSSLQSLCIFSWGCGSHKLSG